MVIEINPKPSGDNEFTKQVDIEITKLLIELRNVTSEPQEPIRLKLRKVYKFYIRDYTRSMRFYLEDYETLKKMGYIKIK